MPEEQKAEIADQRKKLASRGLATLSRSVAPTE